jgi:hypothetical protein
MPKLRLWTIGGIKPKEGLERHLIEIDTERLASNYGNRVVRWSCLVDKDGQPLQLIYAGGRFYVRYTKGVLKKGELSTIGLEDAVWELNIPKEDSDVSLLIMLGKLSQEKLPWDEEVGGMGITPQGYQGRGMIESNALLEQRIQELEQAGAGVSPQELKTANEYLERLRNALEDLELWLQVAEEARRSDRGIVEGLLVSEENFLMQRRNAYVDFLNRLEVIVHPSLEERYTVIAADVSAKWSWIGPEPKWDALDTFDIGTVEPGKAAKIPAPFEQVGGGLYFRKGKPDDPSEYKQHNCMVIKGLDWEKKSKQLEIAVLAGMNYLNINRSYDANGELIQRPIYVSGAHSRLLRKVFLLNGVKAIAEGPPISVDEDIIVALNEDIRSYRRGEKPVMLNTLSAGMGRGRRETLKLAKLIFETRKQLTAKERARGRPEERTTIARGAGAEPSRVAEVELEEPGRTVAVELEEPGRTAVVKVEEEKRGVGTVIPERRVEEHPSDMARLVRK